MNHVHALATAAAAAVPAAGGNFWTFINDQFAQAKAATITAAVVIAVIITLGTYIRSKGSVVATVIAGLVGGALIWLTAGGLESLSNMWGGTVKAAAVLTFPGVV